jgi:hypothetical protein
MSITGIDGGAARAARVNDADRFDAAVRQAIGKRLTYAELTGKVGEPRSV